MAPHRPGAHRTGCSAGVLAVWVARSADRSLPILAPVCMSLVTWAFAPAMVVSHPAGGGRGAGSGAGGHGRLRWRPADAGHGMADAARADRARTDARLRSLGRRRVPPGGAGHQAAASRHRWRGTTGQDQHYPTGEGGGASDRPQRQVGLMAGQRGRPPPACRSPVPRHVTGTMSHVPITPARSRPGRHCSSVTPGNSAGSRPHTRVDPYGGSSSVSGASKKSLATAPIDMSPGWMVSAGPGSAPGLIFT